MEEIENDIFCLCCCSCCRERERDQRAVKDSIRSQKDIVPPFFFFSFWFQFYPFLSVIVNAVGNNLKT